MTAEVILASFLVLALLGAWARLLWWWTRADARPAAWRIAALLLLQPLWLGLLYLTLLPPRTVAARGRLTVLTADWRKATAGQGPSVALPEAGAVPGAERAPDLATALRRHAPTAITIVGRGLEARDRDRLALPLAFAAAPQPNGLIALVPPPPVAPGAAFAVRGQVHGVKGSVELDDPAGRRIDAVAVGEDGAFTLSGSARVPGSALFALKLRDTGGALVEQADVPLRTEAPAATRLLLLGTPDPESKYLRRWATDAGLVVDARLAAGGGITLGTTAEAVSAGSLQKVDMIVIDDRGWGALAPGERAAIVGAVRGGAGLLLRATGPLAGPVAAEWRALGFATAGGQLAPLTLPKEAIDAPAMAARRGPREAAEAGTPALTRSDLRIAAPDAVPFDGGDWLPLGRWRPLGRGRAGLVTVTDSYALGLAGQKAHYGELWSSLIGTLAPPRGPAPVAADPLPHVGERTRLCGLSGTPIAQGAGERAQLLPDPAAGGCAGFWPRRPGWHWLGAQPFYVWPADQLGALRATAMRDATAALVREGGTASSTVAGPRGAAWPWFLAWLAASALLWWFERSRLGRSAEVQRDQQPGEDDI